MAPVEGMPRSIHGSFITLYLTCWSSSIFQTNVGAEGGDFNDSVAIFCGSFAALKGYPVSADGGLEKGKMMPVGDTLSNSSVEVKRR